MRLSFRRPGLVVALLLGAQLAAGCVRRLPDTDPSDLPEIRRELEAQPEDVELRTRLGVALHKAGDHAEAVEVLDGAIEDGASSGAAFLYLGLANEALERWSAARQAYSRYVEVGRFDPLRDELRGRLQLIIREELRAEAREALAQEAQVSAQPPSPRSVAVFPMRWVEGPAELEPLQVALPDMMITDLSQASALTVLERTQIMALVNEMALTESGLTEPGTGARAGRLLRSEHVVQGALTALGDQGLRIDADVLDTRQGQSTREVLEEDQLEAIFDMEKAAVFQILDALGVTLTPAERERIDENRAANLLAFLAYGRGLEALDRGAYDEAEGFFQQAVQQDPNFQPAQNRLQESADLLDAAETPVQQVTERATEEVARTGGDLSGTTTTQEVVVTTEIATTLTHVSEGVDPTPNTGTIDRGVPTTEADPRPPEQQQQQDQQTQREPVPESRGQDQPTATPKATIRITIQRPTGTGGGDR